MMDTGLLDRLRKKAPALLSKWLSCKANEPVRKSRSLRELGTGLLPLLLDSLQFEGFAELEHLAARTGETAWHEGLELSVILESVFSLRLLLRDLLTKKNMPADGNCEEIDREIDRFASVCARAYVKACTRGAAAQSREHADQLQAAFDALVNAVMIVDTDLRLHLYNTAFGEMLALPSAGRAVGGTFGEIAGDETASALRSLLDAAITGTGRVRGVLNLRQGPALTSVVRLTGTREPLLLVEMSLQAAGPPDATRALGRMIQAHGDGPAFGKLVKEMRKEDGISMRLLAQKLGMARGYVSNIENGKAVPSFKAIVRICELLDPEGEKGLLTLGIVERLPRDIRIKLMP